MIEQNKHLRFFGDDFEVNGHVGKYWYHTNAYGDEAVMMCVQTDDGRFVMIEEYRYLIGHTSLGLPAGSIEVGESPLEAARREIQEESGYLASQMVDLGWFATAPAFSKERVRLFLATDVQPTSQRLDPFEQIQTVLMTAEQIDQAIEEGILWDGQAIAAWYKVKTYLSRAEGHEKN